MTNQIKTNTRSMKSTLIAFAAATIVGLSAIPSQAFSPAPSSVAIAAQTAGSTIEQAGYKRHRGHYGRHSLGRHYGGHRGYYGGNHYRGNGYRSNRNGSHNGGYSSNRYVKRNSYRGHGSYNNSHRGHGYSNGLQLNLFGVR